MTPYLFEAVEKLLRYLMYSCGKPDLMKCTGPKASQQGDSLPYKPRQAPPSSASPASPVTGRQAGYVNFTSATAREAAMRYVQQQSFGGGVPYQYAARNVTEANLNHHPKFKCNLLCSHHHPNPPINIPNIKRRHSLVNTPPIKQQARPINIHRIHPRHNPINTRHIKRLPNPINILPIHPLHNPINTHHIQQHHNPIYTLHIQQHHNPTYTPHIKH
uniref:Uncharacterized protein n=1 Tax=Timema cristinae TaxID=61476 RepID=A0A7R9H6U2_TIMCR|nr:unnamed protein product [Timema cristinae]